MTDRLKEKLGFPEKQKERSFWVLGATREAFEAAAPAIEAVAARYPRLKVVVSGPDALLPWLETRFPGLLALAPPTPHVATVRRYVRRVNFRAAAALEGVAPPPALLQAIADEGLTLVALSGRPDAPPSGAVAAAAEDRIVLGEGGAGMPLDAVVDRLGAYLARDVKVRRKSARKGFSLPSLLLGAIERPAGRRLLGRRLRRIADADALAEELGRPETILCLGNGPSSEDSALGEIRFDALFRVNHAWRERGFLARPDVVFTGGTPTMGALDGPVFGVQSESAERRLVGVRALDPRRGPTRFFRVPEIAPALTAYRWGAVRPTNGAAMLAAAVALEPKRLVVAGIDLFRDPAGAYPGDAATPNAFAPAHDADAELDFILSLLSGCPGELIVIGDVLRSAIANRGQEA